MVRRGKYRVPRTVLTRNKTATVRGRSYFRFFATIPKRLVELMGWCGGEVFEIVDIDYEDQSFRLQFRGERAVPGKRFRAKNGSLGKEEHEPLPGKKRGEEEEEVVDVRDLTAEWKESVQESEEEEGEDMPDWKRRLEELRGGE